MGPTDLSWLDFEFDYDEPNSLAETIELILVHTREPFLSLSELRDLFPMGSQPSDTQMTFALGVISDRRQQMGTKYPFTKDRRGVKFHPGGQWELYAFLLLLSFKNMPVRKENAWRTSDPIFDAIVMRAIVNKLGRGSLAVVFGWPARGDRPKNFPEAVEWVSQLLGVELRTAKSKISSNKNDAGVDVIAWSPFGDGSNGFPVYLVQNTIQLQFSDKPRDVRPIQWREWMHIGATPMVGFAVPFAIREGHKWWDDIVSEAGIFFDRKRLVEQFRRDKPQNWDEWSQIRRFVEEELKQVAASTQVLPADAMRRRGAPKKKKP